MATKYIDCAGAGDLFASGFLAGVLAGRPLRMCAQLGCLAGAAVLQAHHHQHPLHFHAFSVWGQRGPCCPDERCMPWWDRELRSVRMSVTAAMQTLHICVQTQERQEAEMWLLRCTA